MRFYRDVLGYPRCDVEASNQVIRPLLDIMATTYSNELAAILARIGQSQAELQRQSSLMKGVKSRKYLARTRSILRRTRHEAETMLVRL